MADSDARGGGGPAARAGRFNRWLLAATVIWALVLAGGVAWAARAGTPTAREQTSVSRARPTVDRAIAEVAVAASADGHAVVAISGFERLGECRVTVLRSGARYQRTVTAFVATGTEQALLDRVAGRLPAEYGATVRRGPAPRLVADVGLFVRLTAGVVGPGQVHFVADTGNCRVEDGVVAADEPEPQPEARAAVEAVLATLGVPAESWQARRVPCAAGAWLSTVEAAGGYDSTPLDAALSPPDSAAVVFASPDAVAYRSGDVGVAVVRRGGQVIVTATTPCR